MVSPGQEIAKSVLTSCQHAKSSNRALSGSLLETWCFGLNSPIHSSADAPSIAKRLPPQTDNPDLSKVPDCYMDLKEVFNKAKATPLPPHPYSGSIDLPPGSAPPKSRC